MNAVHMHTDRKKKKRQRKQPCTECLGGKSSLKCFMHHIYFFSMSAIFRLGNKTNGYFLQCTVPFISQIVQYSALHIPLHRVHLAELIKSTRLGIWPSPTQGHRCLADYRVVRTADINLNLDYLFVFYLQVSMVTQADRCQTAESQNVNIPGGIWDSGGE